MNSFRCSGCSFAAPDVRDLECPLCGALLKMVSVLRGPVQTTWSKTAKATQYAGHVRFRPDQHIVWDHDRVWCFTDGATRGSYAAAVITRAHDGALPVVQRFARYVGRAALPQANVTAEIMGVALGLKQVPEGSRVNVVSDYVGTGCWLAGKWRIKHADALLRLRLIVKLIRSKDLDVTFIHHKGHQENETEFTRYNNLADRLCEQVLPEASSG